MAKLTSKLILRLACLAAIAFVCIYFPMRMSSEMDREDAEAERQDSIRAMRGGGWQYRHSISPRQENYRASLMVSPGDAFTSCDSLAEESPVGISLQVLPYISNQPPQICLEVTGDKFRSPVLKMTWGNGAEHPIMAGIVGTMDDWQDRSSLFLDPYASMLDSIMHHKQLRIRALFETHDTVSFTFYLPPLDTATTGNLKYKEIRIE